MSDAPTCSLVSAQSYNPDCEVTSCRKCGGRGVHFLYDAATDLVLVICKVCSFKYRMLPWDREETT